MSALEIYESQEFFDEDLTLPAGKKEWRWRVKAGNGEIVASGEGYTTERDAHRGFLAAFEAMRKAAEAGWAGRNK